MAKDLSLEQIMETLRSPQGCPWDREQTHQSLRRFLIEECYECCEALDEGDDEHFLEELGDVLLQVVFHAQLAKERSAFDFKDVERKICEKMIRRHPHVFGEVQVEDTAEVKRNWEQIKAKERAEQVPDHDSHVSEILLLDAHLPSGLPAIQKALKIQERAAKKGFDWKGVEGAIAKCREELDELEEAIANADEKNTLEECGDVAFAVVKIARFLNVDVETALQGTNRKFVQRFEAMEKALQCDGTSVSEQELHVLTDYWNRAKRDG